MLRKTSLCVTARCLWSLCILVLLARSASGSHQDLLELLVPEGEPAPSLQTLLAVRLGAIEHMAFSPDGRILAASTNEGGVCLWELSRGRPLRCMLNRKRQQPQITALAFSIKTQWLATGHDDGSVELWRTDGTQGTTPCRMGPLPAQPNLGRAITSLLFTVDGSLLAVGGRNGTARRCSGAFETQADQQPREPRAAEPLPELTSVPSSLFALTVSEPRGSLLAVVTSGALGIWKLPRGERLWLQPVTSLVLSLAMSPDGKQLATGSLNGGLSLWDVATGTEHRLAAAQTSAVRSVVFDADSKQLYAGHEDRSIVQWDTRTGRPVRSSIRGTDSTVIAFRPDGLILATGAANGGITLFETATGSELKTLRTNADWIRSVAFNRGSTRLATASDDGQVRIWQRKAGPEPGPEWSLLCSTDSLQSGIIRGLGFNPHDGNQVAAATDSPTVQLLDAQTCSHSRSLPEQRDWQRSVAFSPDGQQLATAGDDKVISILDLGSSQRKTVLQGHTDAVVAFAFRPPDGTMLLSGSADKTARLWDVAQGKEVYVFKDHAARVRAVDISPDGKLIALASAAETKLWDVRTKRLLWTLPHDKQTVTAVRFHPGGQLIATAAEDGKVRLWDVATRQPRAVLVAEGEPEAVQALDFSDHDDVLAAATLGRVLLWNIADRKLRAELMQGEAGWASLSPGGLLYRSDTGGLLWKQEPRGGMAAVLPPAASRPNLDLQIEFQRAAEPGQLLGTVIAHVHNAAGSGPAYWLAVEASDLPGRTEFREGFSLPSAPVHLRLAPGESAAVPMYLSARQSASLPPRAVHLCITLRHAHDSSLNNHCTGGLSQPVTFTLGPWWWRNSLELLLATAALAGLAGLLLLLLLRRRALQDPVVRSAVHGQECLHGLRLHELAAAEQALRRAEKIFNTRGLRLQALERSGIDAHRWQRVLVAAKSPAACARQLAANLMATVDPSPLRLGPHVTGFQLALRPLSIHVPGEVTLVICTNATSSAQTAVAQCKLGEQLDGRWVLLVDLTAAQEPSEQVQKALTDAHPGIVFVVLSEAVLMRILLAREALIAEDTLREAITQQRELGQLVIYQEGGNEIKDDRESCFFGRRSELQRLIQGHQRNYLLVGPRYMGKSSLLNAFKRELARCYPKVKVLKHQLFNGSLSSIQSIDATLCGDSPEKFYQSVMARAQEHQIFLLDEADKFIEQENKTLYPFCNVMRALSGQGRASFVLAGHLELHAATQIPDHPLRNFGDFIRLEPLDESSAARMILDPIGGLGNRFADEASTVDWLRAQTGCRPHLLAIACWAIANLHKPRSGHAITLEELQREVLSHRNLHAAFGAWENGHVLPMDRALTRAALLLGNPQPAELLDFLRAQGASFVAADLEPSLRRLYAWHYVLIADPHGRLCCPVPLFRHFLSDPNPEFPPGEHFSSPAARLSQALASDLQELAAAR